MFYELCVKKKKKAFRSFFKITIKFFSLSSFNFEESAYSKMLQLFLFHKLFPETHTYFTA